MMRRILLLVSVVVVAMLYGCNKSGGKGGNRSMGCEDCPKNDTTLEVCDSIKPNVNVYVENSGSMDGYVKGATEFENIIYSYLSDIKISGVADSLNLFYINSDVYPFESDTSIDADVLKDFIEKLEPETFQKRGCEKGKKRGTSDIAEIIKTVLKSTGKHDISIMITDGIFSPGKNKNADEYLTNQEVGIKVAMAEHLKAFPESMVVLYMMTSKFNGTFYDKVDNGKNINEDRPFYIWVFGQYRDIVNLQNAVPDSKFKGTGVNRKFEIANAKNDLNYRFKEKRGDNDSYESPVEKGGKNYCKSAKVKVKRDKEAYELTVLVDYEHCEGLMFDKDYLLDKNNYMTGDSLYKVTEVKPLSSGSYSHQLTVELNKAIFPKGSNEEKELNIWFKEMNADWSDVNDDIGGPAISGKTYGIKYQVEGICDAFSPKNGKCAEMTLKVKKGN